MADTFVGDGYRDRRPTHQAIAPRSLLARTEGILLDNDLHGQGDGGPDQLIKDGTFSEQETVLFWHTGGLPAVFR